MRPALATALPLRLLALCRPVHYVTCIHSLVLPNVDEGKYNSLSFDDYVPETFGMAF